MTLLDYYKYASLATAAYVQAGTLNPQDLDYQARFAELGRQQDRLPLSIAEKLFLRTATNQDVWTVAYYYGGDRSDVNDSSGLAATLFQKDGENVLVRS